jgi:hypothetical protein
MQLALDARLHFFIGVEHPNAGSGGQGAHGIGTTAKVNGNSEVPSGIVSNSGGSLVIKRA